MPAGEEKVELLLPVSIVNTPKYGPDSLPQPYELLLVGLIELSKVHCASIVAFATEAVVASTAIAPTLRSD